MEKKKNKSKNTFSELRSFGDSVLNAKTEKTEDFRCSTFSNNEILKINHLDITAADKNAEKILERDDFGNAFFVAPLKCNELIECEDNDGEKYWEKAKPILIERIYKTFGYRYGIDFAILRRGLFSLLVIMTKQDDEWNISNNVLDFIIPDRSDMFFKTLDFYYRHTDSMFFPINAIVASDEYSNGNDVCAEDFKNTEVKTIQIDISFLRSDSFREYESSDGREHATLKIFREAILHSIAMKYRIMSFDDEIIDDMISGNFDNDEPENCDNDEDIEN